MLGHWDYSNFPCWLGHQLLTSRKCWRDKHIRNTFSSWFKHFWLYLSSATKMGFRAQRIPGDRCLNLTWQGEAEEYILGLFLGFALNIEGEKMHWLQGLSRLPPHALHSGWLVRQFKQHLGQSCSPEPSWLFPALLQFLREHIPCLWALSSCSDENNLTLLLAKPMQKGWPSVLYPYPL